MKADAFEAAVERLRTVNEVIQQLDESIRLAAFEILRPYVEGGPGQAPRPKTEARPDQKEREEVSTGDISDGLREFLAEHHSDKPAENVKAIAAFFYSRYGTEPLAAQEVVNAAHEAGITIPNRVDVTLGSLKVNKKPLFSKLRSGVYKPTVHGEKYFKETYDVKKGTKRRADSQP